MKILICAVLMFVSSDDKRGEDYAFTGPWKTTNRKLDGVMNCITTPLANQKWEARFSGTWQGVDFDHNVTFQGPPDDLRGTAIIDGASYQWRGRIDAQSFRANFTGDRYERSFDLKRTRLPITQVKR
jgi:hypothetical protein